VSAWISWDQTNRECGIRNTGWKEGCHTDGGWRELSFLIAGGPFESCKAFSSLAAAEFLGASSRFNSLALSSILRRLHGEKRGGMEKRISTVVFGAGTEGERESV